MPKQILALPNEILINIASVMLQYPSQDKQAWADAWGPSGDIVWLWNYGRFVRKVLMEDVERLFKQLVIQRMKMQIEFGKFHSSSSHGFLDL